MAFGIAAQMYTVREHTKTARDLAETLRKLRAIGYEAVQMSAVGAMNGDSPEVTAAEARKMLDDNGLRCIATHRPWDTLANDTEAEIEFHRTLGCDFTAIGSLPKRYEERGMEGYLEFTDDARPVIERLKAGGVRFGYHNHAFEFEVADAEATSPTLFDLLADTCPELLFEPDVYWIAHAGRNPVRVLEKLAGRIPVVHVKDREVVRGEGPVMAPVGEGLLEWDAILPACRAAGVEWVAVEQDEYRRDPFDCLASSFLFLSGFAAERGW